MKHTNTVEFHTNAEKRQVIAVLYHHGKRLSGTATCNAEDTFSDEAGHEIAHAKVLAARDRMRAEEARGIADLVQSIANGHKSRADGLRDQARRRVQVVRDKYHAPTATDSYFNR